MAKKLRLILGDQLNPDHSWYTCKDPDTLYVLMEVMQEQNYVKHHIQKILSFFAAMRNFAFVLKKQGHRVLYIELDDTDNLQSFDENLQRIIAQHGINVLEYQQPDEYRLDEQLKTLGGAIGIPVKVYDTEHFMTHRFEVRDYFIVKQQYLMESFYRYMRRKWNILIAGDKPLGDKWNFDHENRKKYDGKAKLHGACTFNHDVTPILQMVDKMQVKYFGEVDAEHLPWPLSQNEALTLIDYFCENLLPHFGTYEDAMLKNHATLFHSRLSFCLNVKLVSPLQVIHKVIGYWNKHPDGISIAQVEGFVRQIVGWREFMRGVYWAKMPGFAKLNYFENRATLPHWFWTAETKMNCLKHCIGQSLQSAHAHHIQRLMVIGNFCLLAGIDPDQVDEWYLGVYIDAIEWVQITNTRGMSQYADGGIIASKPYAASSAYINKMSDYCKGCHYDRDKRYGDGACPYNSLYWNFYHRNSDKLRGNHRVMMGYKTLDKMPPNELRLLNEQANLYLASLDEL
ncbi:cryptochrome/photolyase family protein [uncultured Mucilaginibacter sp.]|uniref:cryptochrome/photolyase family protein n=1 Tax=uncultured Mucilaginibacter sp. TaxID=797541 RepID=UPI0025D36735|nr:cryptochrome/photolyase family protein [uncultured Mucilaginibacter sp.]